MRKSTRTRRRAIGLVQASPVQEGCLLVRISFGTWTFQCCCVKVVWARRLCVCVSVRVHAKSGMEATAEACSNYRCGSCGSHAVSRNAYSGSRRMHVQDLAVICQVGCWREVNVSAISCMLPTFRTGVQVDSTSSKQSQKIARRAGGSM